MDMNIDWVGITAITGLVSSFAGFFFGHRKRRVETTGDELRNMQLVIQVWREVADSQSAEVATLRTEIVALRKEMKEMHRETESLKSEIISLKEQFVMQCKTCIFRNQPDKQ